MTRTATKQRTREGPRLALPPGERRCAHEIAARAVAMARELGHDLNPADVYLDIAAAHLNGSPLALGWLLASSDLNFAHDVFGIREHIDRETGKLGGFFTPRASSVARRKGAAS